MDSKKSKTLVINTLLLIFCVVVIALFCFGPTEEKEIVVFRKTSAVIAHYFQILIYHFYIPSNFELDIRL